LSFGWRGSRVAGRRRAADDTPSLAARTGTPRVDLPVYYGRRFVLPLLAELARGELVELLHSCRPEAMPINLVYPSGRLVPARVRVAIEALTALRRRAPRSRGS
jgi:hypothetical protein